MSIYVIGDIHGCFDTFMALLKQLPKDAKIALVGDLIDRGPKSRQVVQYVIDNNIDCVMGNHEDMMVKWPRHWDYNGGEQTLESYNINMFWNKDKPQFSDEFDAHRKWMETLPVYLEYPDIKKDDRHLVVSHSIIHNYWKLRNEEGHKKATFNERVMWGRSFHKMKDQEDIYNIIGHTPQENEATIKKIYANVDTGACYNGYTQHGFMTALKFPEMELITQKNVDIY